jgi:hypothetical protein
MAQWCGAAGSTETPKPAGVWPTIEEERKA